MNKYYFDFDQNLENNGGNKATKDATVIFERSGYQKLTPAFIKITGKNNLLRGLLYPLSAIFTILFKLPKNAVIIMNYRNFPIRERLTFNFLRQFKTFKQFKLVALVHDLQELFDGKMDDKQVFSVKNLKSCDIVISHNPIMSAWLLEQGFQEKQLVNLGIFDYLVDLEKVDGGYFGRDIVIAGALSKEKAPYLEKLSELKGSNFRLYGPNFAQDLTEIDNMDYLGNLSPEEVVTKISGSYGLVWDSQELRGGVGPYAAYQRYNNPHKVSLYLTAGFPVIIWKEAALADLIAGNGLGILVSDLSEVPEKLAAIRAEDYAEMKKNVLAMSEKLRAGDFLSQALVKTDEQLNMVQ